MRGAGLKRWATSSISVSGATLATYGLFGVIGAILVGSVYTSLRPLPKAPKVHIPEPTAGAEGAAVECVLTWLRAGKGAGSLRPCFAVDADLNSVTPMDPARIARAGSVGVAELGPGYWSVTVAVELDPEPAPTTVVAGPSTTVPPPVMRYFRLGVRSDAGRYVAVALPQPTAAPLVSVASNLAVEDLAKPRTDDPVANVVGLYLAASLAGDGELRYYAFPGSDLAPVTPAPYSAIKVTRIAYRDIRETRREVLVEALGTDAAGRTQLVNVALEVARRAQRWEVAAELAAPSLSARQPTPAATTPRATSTTAVAPTTTTSGVRPIRTIN